MIFLKGVKLDFVCMKIKLMKNEKISAANIFTKGTCNQNYGGFYVKGKQELRSFYM